MYTILFPIVVPILFGILMLLPEPERRKNLTEAEKRTFYNISTGLVLIASGLGVLKVIFSAGEMVTLFTLHPKLPIILQADGLGKLFALLVTIIWICGGFFAFSYMEHEKNVKRYFAFYLMSYGVLIGLDFSGNLITMYAFYELMTLCTFPLVIHNQSKEAVMAAMKYLLYSFFGAYMALFGIYFLVKYTNTLSFTPGGTLSALAQENQPLLLLITFLMLMGFGVKAGMFPVHGWLPTAHPAAPAPASAVLSAIIVKSGILAMIRTVYYIIGPDFIRNTWVQTVWLTLSLITVFLGSMLAFQEKVLKKRLAYSTVSQVSYIIFGLALLNPIGMAGSFLHVAAHAMIKCTLFFVAGAIIYKTGCTKVDELDGIGKRMPVTMWCYTIASLGLIGIPPTGGFISKWYLAGGALDSGIKIFSVAGPIVLLVSALLTAGYLLPISIKGFLPGEDFDGSSLKKCEPDKRMLVPIVILTALSVLIGLFPNLLVQYFAGLISSFM